MSDTALELINIETAKERIKNADCALQQDCLDAVDASWEAEQKIHYSGTSIEADELVINRMTIINGDLNVDYLEGEYHSFLIVLGDLTVERASIRSQIIVTGNASINDVGVFESFGDNALTVANDLVVSELIEIDHHINVLGEFEIEDIYYERGAEFEGISFSEGCLDEDDCLDFYAMAKKVKNKDPIFIFDD